MIIGSKREDRMSGYTDNRHLANLLRL